MHVSGLQARARSVFVYLHHMHRAKCCHLPASFCQAFFSSPNVLFESISFGKTLGGFNPTLRTKALMICSRDALCDPTNLDMLTQDTGTKNIRNRSLSVNIRATRKFDYEPGNTASWSLANDLDC